MSDYLARLIARSVGPSESIRPRVPALFEPSDLASQQSEGESVSVEAARPPAWLTRAIGSEENRRRPPTLDRPVHPPAMPLHQEVSQAKAADEPTFVYRGNVNATPPLGDGSYPQRNPMTEPTFRNADRAHAPHSHDRNTHAPTTPNDVRAVRRPTPIGLGRSEVQAPSVYDMPDKDQAPAPIVRVTIGRIDVRAIVPTGDTRRPNKATAPKLSLNDYLARRGTRRS